MTVKKLEPRKFVILRREGGVDEPVGVVESLTKKKAVEAALFHIGPGQYSVSEDPELLQAVLKLAEASVHSAGTRQLEEIAQRIRAHLRKSLTEVGHEPDAVDAIQVTVGDLSEDQLALEIGREILKDFPVPRV